MTNCASPLPRRSFLCAAIAACLLAIAATGSLAGAAAPQDPLLEKANTAFREGKWEEARRKYGDFFKAAETWNSAPSREALRNAVECSLKLRDWRAALEQIERFRRGRPADENDDNKEQRGAQRGVLAPRRDLGSSERLRENREQIRKEECAGLKLCRALLNRLAEQSADAPADFKQKLAKSRIAGNFRLVHLLERQSHESVGVGWAEADNSWWWRGIPAADRFFAKREERPAYQQAIFQPPVTDDGEPMLLSAPETLEKARSRGEMILFLLDEIVRLDPTADRDFAAAAVMMRFSFMYRLYVPLRAAEWADEWLSSSLGWSASWHWMGNTRQSEPETSAADQQLAEDETRMLIDGELQTVELPPSHSPLALLRSIEKRFPDSRLVPDAIYRQGAFYQQRGRYEKARAEYRRLIDRFPKHERAKSAGGQIDNIESPDVVLEETGITPLGTRPEIPFSVRATAEVRFTARRFDLAGFFRAAVEEGEWLRLPEFVGRGSDAGYGSTPTVPLGTGFFSIDDGAEWKKFVGDKAVDWKASVPKSLSVSREATTAPLREPGAYLVEATTDGDDAPSRTLVVVSGIGIVTSSTPGAHTAWVVDSRTGKPLAGQRVEIYTRSPLAGEPWTWQKATGVTDADGLLVAGTTTDDDCLLLVEDEKRGMGFSTDVSGDPGFSYAYAGRTTGRMAFVVTDRPVYQPGDTVHLRVWERRLHDRSFRPAEAGARLGLEVVDGQSETYTRLQVTLDGNGTGTASVTLSEEAALGLYQVGTTGADEAVPTNAAFFRVEEYKKPEFEVTVSPVGDRHRLGRPLKARIEARYYFGRPVDGGTVQYKVYRRPRLPSAAPPHRFDWLYGNGFGLPGGRLAWLYAMTDRQGLYFGYGSNRFDGSLDWLFGYQGERVASGTATLDHNGVAEIQVDTDSVGIPPFEDDRRQASTDYSYRIVADVRDDSRRTVTGSGEVLVAARQFHAYVEPDRNWYSAAETATVRITARTAGGTPVATEGEVVLFRHKRSAGENAHAESEKTPVARWKVATNNRGEATARVPLRDPGRYRMAFHAEDAWGQAVRGWADVWVHEPGFEALETPLPDLELIPDERTYRPGGTARVLVVTRYKDVVTMLSDSSRDDRRLVTIDGPMQVVELPVGREQSPNVVLHGVFVKEGRMHDASCELFVPPADRLLTVKLMPDRKWYRPGEAARVDVQVTDSRGRPVTGELTLAAYDKALTQIQPDEGFHPRWLFTRLVRSQGSVSIQSSLRPALFHSQDWMLLPKSLADLDTGPHLVLDEVTDDEWRATTLQLIIRQSQHIPEFETTLSLIVREPSWTARESGAFASTSSGLGGLGGGIGGLGGGLGFGGVGHTALAAPKRPPPVIVRSDLADRALWFPSVQLDESGRGSLEIPFPEMLTTWRLRGYVVTSLTQVGRATVEVVTSKNLLVRLQSPRFFVEQDRVTLSANVHNYLSTEKSVSVELIVPAKLFQPDGDGESRTDAEGNLYLKAEGTVGADGQRRFDFPLRVRADGLAEITVKALTDEESDAVAMAFPVEARGYSQQVARSGSVSSGTQRISFTVPKDIDPQKTKVEVTLAPSTVAVMLDALPYLARYPYGCVEQTMSRFYPLVLARKSLEDLGTNLEALGEAQRRDKRGALRPVYDPREAQRMIEAGLQRLYRFQHEDGGWGWWQHDGSTRYMTAYVLLGLHTAAESGVTVRDRVVRNGLSYLHEASRDGGPATGRQRDKLHEQALVAYVATLEWPGRQNLDIASDFTLLEPLLQQRGKLNPYGKALLAIGLYNGFAFDSNKQTAEHRQQAERLLAEILKTAKHDERTQASWVPVAGDDYRWWSNPVEANAWVLRALMAIDPENARIPEIVGWLARQRLGTRWDSTRSTATAVAALAEHVQRAGPKAVETDVEVRLDGQPVATSRLGRDEAVGGGHRIEVPAGQLDPGDHTITLVNRREPAVHYSLSVDTFRKPEHIRSEATGLAVKRRYYRVPATHEKNNERTPLDNASAVKVGDVIEVELQITAEADYDYVAFEDPKPAGCEPVSLRSGHQWENGFFANVELRERRVVFFATWIPRGRHTVRYSLRAETPGRFHVLPTKGFAMYAPEVHARSAENRLSVSD